jgi:hypothetical protein
MTSPADLTDCPNCGGHCIDWAHFGKPCRDKRYEQERRACEAELRMLVAHYLRWQPDGDLSTFRSFLAEELDILEDKWDGPSPPPGWST